MGDGVDQGLIARYDVVLSGNLLALVSQYVWVVDDDTHPVRYIRQMGSVSPAMLLEMRLATNHTRAAAVRRVGKCMAPDSSLSIHETNQIVRRRR